MENEIKLYLQKRTKITIILIEIISVLMISLVNFSIIKLLSLTILNVVIFTFSIGYFKIYTREKMGSMKIWNELNPKSAILSLLSGIVITIYSYFQFPRFFAFGIAMLISTMIPLVLWRRFSELSNKLKHYSTAKAREIHLDRSFFTIIFVIVVPLLLDLHYNILAIPISTYFTMLTVYFLSIASTIVASLIRAIQE